MGTLLNTIKISMIAPRLIAVNLLFAWVARGTRDVGLGLPIPTKNFSFNPRAKFSLNDKLGEPYQRPHWELLYYLRHLKPPHKEIDDSRGVDLTGIPSVSRLQLEPDRQQQKLNLMRNIIGSTFRQKFPGEEFGEQRQINLYNYALKKEQELLDSCNNNASFKKDNEQLCTAFAELTTNTHQEKRRRRRRAEIPLEGNSVIYTDGQEQDVRKKSIEEEIPDFPMVTSVFSRNVLHHPIYGNLFSGPQDPQTQMKNSKNELQRGSSRFGLPQIGGNADSPLIKTNSADQKIFDTFLISSKIPTILSSMWQTYTPPDATHTAPNYKVPSSLNRTLSTNQDLFSFQDFLKNFLSNRGMEKAKTSTLKKSKAAGVFGRDERGISKIHFWKLLEKAMDEGSHEKEMFPLWESKSRRSNSYQETPPGQPNNGKFQTQGW